MHKFFTACYCFNFRFRRALIIAKARRDQTFCSHREIEIGKGERSVLPPYELHRGCALHKMELAIKFDNGRDLLVYCVNTEYEMA